MSSNPNVLLRIFENSKPETCDEIEPDSNKRFYTQGQVKQIQEAVELYVERKKILEDNIGNNSITVKDLEGILNDLGDANDSSKRQSFIPNRITIGDDEVTIKDELIGMKKTYEENHKKFEKEYNDFFQKKLNQARKNNPFTVPIGNADVLQNKFIDMERRNNEYKNTEEPFKSLLECASFVETREELLQKLFKLFTGVAALDDAATRKKFPMNFWDPSVTATDVIQDIEKAILEREKAIKNYKEEYNINNAEDFVRANGQNFPTLDEVFKYETNNVRKMTQRIRTLASKRQQTQASIQAAKDRYKSAFSNSPDNVKNQIDDFDNEQLINKQRSKRLDLLKELKLIRSNPPQNEVYKNMLDNALENILQKRKKLLKNYETTFKFEIKDNNNRGLYQASDDDIQKEIDGRKKLLEEADNLYTPGKLQKINKNEEINSKFKSLIVRRKTLVDKLNKYRADIDKGDWKGLDDADLKELVEKREQAVNDLKNTFESATDVLFKKEISVQKIEKLKELANERNEVLDKLKKSYNGEDGDLPFNYKSKSLDDIRNILNERLKQYEKVAQKVKKLSGNTNTNPLTNDPKLKVLKEELTKLEEERMILEGRLNSLSSVAQQQWTQEPIQTNQNLEKFINSGSTTNELVKETELIQNKIEMIDTSISNALVQITTNPGNISKIKQIYKEQTDAFDLEKKKFANLQNRIKNETSISSSIMQLMDKDIIKAEETIKEVGEKIENLGVLIKKQEKSRREIDEIAPEKDILSFQPNINTTTVKNILAEEIIKSKNNDNENGSLKNIVLNKEGFNVGGDTLSKGYYPVLWLQKFTNIDDNNKRLQFINRYDGQQVLGYASNEALFDASKTGFAWSEQGKNGSIFWVNGWCRITINENITARGQIILDELGFGIIKPNQTLYINLENRTEILARTEFLEKLKNNLEKFGDYEKRSVNKNVEYNVKVQNWFDGANFAKVPLDEVEHIDFSGSNANPIKYLIAPSREEFIKSIREEYEKKFRNNEYPDLQSRTKIQNLFNVLFLKAGNVNSGVSWNGQGKNAIDLTDDSMWSNSNFTLNLARNENTIGKIAKLENNQLRIVDSQEKIQAMKGEAGPDVINDAFWNQIKFELVDGGSPRILVHRISKYKQLERESDEPTKTEEEPEFYVECISDAGDGYCLRYDTTVAEDISSFFDEEKKLFIFKDEDDVKRRNSTALATSSLVNEELLDTDDESVQTFRFVPNI